MLHTCAAPPVPTSSSSSDPQPCPLQPSTSQSHHHMVLRESYGGGHEGYDLDHHVRHKPLKRRGLSKFYHSKSRSFSSLELACASVYGESARGLAKRQNSGELTMTAAGPAAAALGARAAGPALSSRRTLAQSRSSGSAGTGTGAGTQHTSDRSGHSGAASFTDCCHAHGSLSSPQCSVEACRVAADTLSRTLGGVTQTMSPLILVPPRALPCHIPSAVILPTSASLSIPHSVQSSSPANFLGPSTHSGSFSSSEEAGSLQPSSQHKDMEGCTLSTSAPSASSGLLMPSMRYSTEELCAALQSTSLARASLQASIDEQQCAASDSNKERSSNSRRRARASHFTPPLLQQDLSAQQQQQQQYLEQLLGSPQQHPNPHFRPRYPHLQRQQQQQQQQADSSHVRPAAEHCEFVLQPFQPFPASLPPALDVHNLGAPQSPSSPSSSPLSPAHARALARKAHFCEVSGALPRVSEEWSHPPGNHATTDAGQTRPMAISAPTLSSKAPPALEPMSLSMAGLGDEGQGSYPSAKEAASSLMMSGSLSSMLLDEAHDAQPPHALQLSDDALTHRRSHPQQQQQQQQRALFLHLHPG